MVLVGVDRRSVLDGRNITGNPPKSVATTKRSIIHHGRSANNYSRLKRARIRANNRTHQGPAQPKRSFRLSIKRDN